ncbi:hypothetical protein DFS34DRAFT_377267 [Phlyctochytrium arcticum]|nr:hypothetical protein DFS34DRAFT_377267 [Phlyctochytrium arcticum]
MRQDISTMILYDIVANIDSVSPDMFKKPPTPTPAPTPAPLPSTQPVLQQMPVPDPIQEIENPHPSPSKHELKKRERFQKERESLVDTMRNVVKSFKMDEHYESQENFKRFFFLNLSTHTKSRGTNKKITKESVWRLYETVMETDGFVQVHQYFCKECDNFWKRGCCDKYKKSTRGNRLWIVKNACFPDKFHEHCREGAKWGKC